ncbi:hypothetical protein NQ176_g3374 [Zarea fungicola]|uniref:Uncharacterized protein n=1 Tax=Zarea fungicola TaxID=93591 RepID=A0ACC1NK43_9HYPO|nr:hypothetical protein NQ176_g3374 [Lecanicillium fungicola]
MPVSAVEHGQNLATNSQLSWYTEPLLAASVLEDSSSQGSSQSEARLNPETPSFQAAERKEETLENTTANVKKPKRSRPNRYKNAPPAVIQRRRAANRKSQRAYRKRKDDRIAELEELLHQATQREREMSNAYMALRVNYEQLLMIGGPSNSHHSRSLSTASTATGITALSLTTAATSEEEDAASSFMAMAAFSHNNSSHHDSHHQHQNPLGLSPQMAHPQQQAAASPQLLSAYPPPPM